MEPSPMQLLKKKKIHGQSLGVTYTNYCVSQTPVHHAVVGWIPLQTKKDA